METGTTFTEWLKTRRRLLDLTQSELAARVSCSPVTIKKIEAGDLRPSKQLAELMARTLGIAPDQQDAFVHFARSGEGDFAPGPWPVAPPAPAPTQPAPQPFNNLPAQMTALLGREREVAAAVRLLRQPGVRLVTLTGPPGAGKTRLSIEIAEALAGEFADGVCFVLLEPVVDPPMVLPTIAQALDLKEASGVDLVAAVRQFLSRRTLLLVLDNFEQVLAAAPALADLLAAARNLKLLVSSRERLQLYGEREFPVPPLALPDVNRLPPIEALTLYPAIELFVERAQAVQPTFELTADNADAVARICAWLDGLPLAIEMAAARSRWAPPAQVLKQISQSLAALTGNLRDLSPRQQTMRGAIDWSYNLLSPGEVAAFEHAAVFAGGFSAAALAAVLGCAPVDGDEEPWDLLALLQALTEKSLLRCEQQSTGAMRFGMLEVVHAYARERLAAGGGSQTASERHAAYFGSLTVRTLDALRGEHPKGTLEQLKQELNNLRQALEWRLADDPVAGLRMACTLAAGFWPLVGFYSEGERWLEHLLAAVEQQPQARQEHALIAETLQLCGHLANYQGNHPVALERTMTALALAQQVDDRATQRRCLRILGSLALSNSDYPRAEESYHKALALWQPGDDPADAIAIFNGLGLAAKDQGDYRGALELHERSRVLAQQTGYRIGEAHSATLQSIVAYWQGEYHQAELLARRCIALRKELGEYAYMTYAKEIVAMSVARQGDLTAGMRLLEECLVAFRSINNQMGAPLILNDMGQVAHLQGRLVDALHFHHRALAAAIAVNDRRRVAFCLEGFGLAAADCAQEASELPVLATQLLAAAEALRRAIHAALPPSETALHAAGLARLAALLPTDRFEAAWAAGAALTIEETAQVAEKMVLAAL